jgi:hypothetical protein
METRKSEIRMDGAERKNKKMDLAPIQTPVVYDIA